MINQIPLESLKGPLVFIDLCVHKRNCVLHSAFDCGPHRLVLECVEDAGSHILKDFPAIIPNEIGALHYLVQYLVDDVLVSF
jgi:hypothetical protein